MREDVKRSSMVVCGSLAHGFYGLNGYSPIGYPSNPFCFSSYYFLSRKERKERKEMEGGNGMSEANEVTLRRATGVNPWV